MDYLRGTFGLAIIVLVALFFSSNKKKIDWRLVVIGISLQLVFGFLITKVEFVRAGFELLSEGFVKFLSFSEAGAIFIFGDLAGDSFGFIFAFKVLPTIIFFSTVSSGLYYLGILQKNRLRDSLGHGSDNAAFGPGITFCGRKYLSWAD